MCMSVEAKRLLDTFWAIICLWTMGPVLEGSEAPKILPASSFNVILQADKLANSRDQASEKLSKLKQNIVIIDYSFDGSESQKWTPRHIHNIKFSSRRPKLVLAYLSIGEAESYRSYWQNKWKKESSRPNFILTENPHWEGNFKVKFWDSKWQSLVIKSLNEIIDQGFDGVFLDIVDGFEYFEFQPGTGDYLDNRINKETNRSYREDMVAWVKRISQRARFRKPGFFVLPQNGAQLLSFPIYCRSISGIVVEDLWTDGKTKNSNDTVDYKSLYLKKARKSMLPVYVIEYCQDKELKKNVIQWSRQLPASLLITDRDLGTLGVSYTF